MIYSRPSEEEILRLRAIANYQFGRGAGEVLIPEDVIVAKSPNTLRIRHVLLEGRGTIVTLRAQDSLYSLHLLGGEMLLKAYEPPKFRVIVSNSVAEYVKRGGNVFAKHVVDLDLDLRAGGEAVVVDENDRLLGVGRLRLSPLEIPHFSRGEAVRVRHAVSG